MLIVSRTILAGLFVFTFLSGSEAQMPVAAPAQQSGVTTLFALDPISQSLCMRDGGFGSVVQDGLVFNRCSDLNFNSYSKDGFSVGIEGGREGRIIDIGSANDLQGRYGYTETVGNVQGFASIDFRNGRLSILKNYRDRTFQEMDEHALLFQSPQSSSSAGVKLGHIYVARLTDRHDREFERIAKLIVLAHSPNEFVTIRWQVISESKANKN